MTAPTLPAPLYRDPIHNGATDPLLVFHRGERAWWLFYTARRADAPVQPGVAWVHGTDIGIASSRDGGLTWDYRGTAAGLDIEWGRHTYWAPEIIDDGETYHMYVSVVRGVPTSWGRGREIRHYTSGDLATWRYVSTLDLSSPRVIDAGVAARPDGGWRMWYKDEDHGSATWYADSDDLASWRVGGPAVTHAPHEGPCVFRLGGAWWMVVDEWHGLRVLRSEDLLTWQVHGLLLDRSGSRTDDQGFGHHASVVTDGADEATIVYFTHPERSEPGQPGASETAGDPGRARRSAVQVARLRVSGGTVVCDRDDGDVPLLPVAGPQRT